MKQKDILLIVVVVFFSGTFSLFISNVLISSPSNRQEKVEVVEPIEAAFNTPDNKFFNKDAVNPTKLIKIGDKTNPNPFDSQ